MVLVLLKLLVHRLPFLAQLDNINDKPGADSLAIELTDSSTGSNIITLADLSYVSGVDGSALSAITGTIPRFMMPSMIFLLPIVRSM